MDIPQGEKYIPEIKRNAKSLYLSIRDKKCQNLMM